MRLFYLALLGLSISSLMGKNNDLEKLLLAIDKKRKFFIVIAYIYIIFFIGFCSFPITMSKHNPSSFLMLITSFYMSIIFYGLYKNRPLFVLITTFLLNSIGLLGRVLLEWGEASMTRDLTQLNVGLHLTIIPVLITFIYCLIPRIRKAKN